MKTVLYLQAALDLIAAKKVLEQLLADNPDDAEAIKALAKLDHTAPRYKWLRCIYNLYESVREESDNKRPEPTSPQQRSEYIERDVLDVAILVEDFDTWQGVISDGMGREVNICHYSDPYQLGADIEAASRSGLMPRVLLYRSSMDVIPFVNQESPYLGRYRVVRVNNHDALCVAGRGTSWCTASRAGKYDWDDYLSLFGGNTPYVIQTVYPDADENDPDKYKAVYLVRVSNHGYVGLIRRDDNSAVYPEDKDFKLVERILRDTGVVSEIDLHKYGPGQRRGSGGGEGMDEGEPADAEYGRFAPVAFILRSFGFLTAEQWQDALDEIRPKRIVVPDIGRLIGLLPKGYQLLLSTDLSRNRDLLVRLALNYASNRTYNKTRRILRNIASRFDPDLDLEDRIAAAKIVWFVSVVLGLVDADRLAVLVGSQRYMSDNINLRDLVDNIDHIEFVIQHRGSLYRLRDMVAHSRYLRWPERQPADPSSEIDTVLNEVYRRDTMTWGELQRRGPANITSDSCIALHTLGEGWQYSIQLSRDAKLMLENYGARLAEMGPERLRALLEDEYMSRVIMHTRLSPDLDNIIYFYEPLRAIFVKHFGEVIYPVTSDIITGVRLTSIEDVRSLDRILGMMPTDVANNVLHDILIRSGIYYYGIKPDRLERCLVTYLRSQSLPQLDHEHEDEFVEYVKQCL